MSSGPPPERPRRRRWLRRLVLGVLLLGVLVFVFRRPLLGPLIVGQLESAATGAGGRLTIGSIGGGWIDDFALEGVDWTSDTATVRDARLHVRFSLWDAVRGEPTWLREVTVSATTVAVDLSQPSDSEPSSTGFELPRYLPPAALDVQQIRVELQGGRQLALDDLAFELVEREADAALDWSVRGELDEGRLAAAGSANLAAATPELRLEALDLTYGPDRVRSDGLVVPLALTSAAEALRHTQGEFDVLISEATLREYGPRFREEAPIKRLELHGVFGQEGRADLSGSLEAATGGVALRSGWIELDAVADDWRSAAVGLVLDVDFDSLTPLSDLLDREPWSGALRGQLEVSGTLGQPTAALQVAADAVELEGFAFDRLKLDAGWDELGGVVELELAALERELRGRARVQVPSKRVDVVLEELDLTGTDGAWRLIEPTALVFTEDELAWERFALSSGQGTARGSLFLGTSRTELGLGLEEFDLDLLEGFFLPPGWYLGEITGRVDGFVAGGEHNVDFDLVTPELRPGPGQLGWSFALKGRVGQETLVIEQLEGETEGGIVRAQVELPFDPDGAELFPPGEIGLAAYADGVDLGVWGQLLPEAYRADGRVDLELEVGGTWERPEGRLVLSTRDLAPASPRLPDVLYPLQVTIALELEEKILVREASVRAATGLAAELAGEAELPAESSQWFEDPASLLDMPLALRGELTAPTLDGLANSMQAVRRASGRLKATGELSGSLAEPHWAGDVELEEGEVRLTTDIPSIRAITARFRVEDHLWCIERLVGEVGGAPIRFGGQLDNSGDQPVVELEFEGERVLLVRTPDTKVRADAKLSVTGPLDALHASGELVLTEGRHVRSIDIFQGLLPSRGPSRPSGQSGISFSLARTPPLSAMTVDVAIRSEAPFTIRNNLVRAEFRPELRLLGNGEVLFLRGPVYVDPSRLALPSGRLQIESGTIEFRRDAPFVPELQLSAEMRARGFDIDAQITGPYDSPEIVLSSNPPLPNDELLLLFLTGQTPSESPEEGLGAVETVGVFLAQDALSRWLFEADVDADDNPLDRIDFTMGAEVSQSGAPTASGVYYLGERPSGRGRFQYLMAERDRWDRVNYGFGFLFRFR